MAIYNHFWPFFCQLNINLSQIWGSDGHFEILSVSRYKLDQKLCHDISRKLLFSCLKMHHFRAILPKWVLTPQIKSYFCLFFGALVYSECLFKSIIINKPERYSLYWAERVFGLQVLSRELDIFKIRNFLKTF